MSPPLPEGLRALIAETVREVVSDLVATSVRDGVPDRGGDQVADDLADRLGDERPQALRERWAHVRLPRASWAASAACRTSASWPAR